MTRGGHHMMAPQRRWRSQQIRLDLSRPISIRIQIYNWEKNIIWGGWTNRFIVLTLLNALWSLFRLAARDFNAVVNPFNRCMFTFFSEWVGLRASHWSSQRRSMRRLMRRLMRGKMWKIHLRAAFLNFDIAGICRTLFANPSTLPTDFFFICVTPFTLLFGRFFGVSLGGVHTKKQQHLIMIPRRMTPPIDENVIIPAVVFQGFEFGPVSVQFRFSFGPVSVRFRSGSVRTTSKHPLAKSIVLAVSSFTSLLNPFSPSVLFPSELISSENK